MCNQNPVSDLIARVFLGAPGSLNCHGIRFHKDASANDAAVFPYARGSYGLALIEDARLNGVGWAHGQRQVASFVCIAPLDSPGCHNTAAGTVEHTPLSEYFCYLSLVSIDRPGSQ
jgi:hypothetical protein